MGFEFLSIIADYFLKFYNSSFFLVVKFLLAIYVSVLFADIILLLVLRGVGGNIRANFKGMDIPVISPSAMAKKWDKVMARLESGNPSQYKAAILEADAIADEIVKGIGYAGANMTERLEQAVPGQLENLEDLKRAHAMRNRIVFETDLSINKKEAEEIIAIYEKLLKSLAYL